MDTIIDIKGLTKHYPMGNNRFTALRDISISFAKGEFTGIIGPSGSGKTTLLNIIGTLDVPSEGEVLLLGRSVGKLSPKEAADLRKKSLGFIFQTYNLLPVYTVYENVEFPLLLLGLTEGMRRKMVMEALDWVGLASRADSRPSRLSGGECQRVAIARAMVKKPILVLADEPTANLDAANSHHILQTMERLNRELGTSFLFATHDEKVIGYVRRKVKLDDGRLAADEIVTPK